MTILIVEDNFLFREALYDSLRAHFPFALLAKANGVQEALAAIEELRPGVIFLDVHLPDGNGLELTRRLRARGTDALVAVFTSHDLPEYREEALRSGADHFLVKGSASLSDIFSVVESALAARFRALVVAEDAAFSEQMSLFLKRTWPDTVPICATDWEEALETAISLKPHLVVLRSGASAESERGFCEAMHARCAGVGMSVVSVRGAAGGATQECPADHCLAEGAECGEEMAAIVNALRHAHAGESKN
ncbi:MAG: response regulator transcription factor [Betaproteobacteria bacterium]|nr:response regulator transcription factor [Betaproteobacteria bacterium]